jgi:8-oxo-dGTP pyrophosphatase MutT (NUDIX family)
MNDITSYENAIKDDLYADGGTTNKKVYVSIQLPYKYKKIGVDETKGVFKSAFSIYYNYYDEKPFEELKNGKLNGLVGVSTSPNNIAEWFIHRDCLIVMDYNEFIKINETETINYSDPYQLMKNNLYLFKRLYANITRYGEQEGSYIFTQTLRKILEKIIPEINLEINLSDGQKYYELNRISRFLSPYETSAFTKWIEEYSIKIENPIDLTNAILEFNKLNDNYLGKGFENPVLTFEELLPIVEKGIIKAGKIYESEQEIVLTNKELNIPKKSQLFFIKKNELNTNDNDRDIYIEKYKLKDLYKVYFVALKEIEKYRSIWLKKEEEKFNKNLEQGRQDLELKKDQVVNELLSLFLDKSLNSFKQEIEKEILQYNDSLLFYDRESDDYIEENWYSIPLVQMVINKYIEIVNTNWDKFIKPKKVSELNLYIFSQCQGQIDNDLRDYFENNKSELDKINNYKNINSGYLSSYTIEYLLKKSINDYEDLPEWISYKDLSKMYLEKMGVEIYRYYDKKDLPLISQYKNGGATNVPTEFWGNVAGGVLIYCSGTNRYLLLKRSDYVQEPNTWGIISGKLDDDENVEEAVEREAKEETGFQLRSIIPAYVFKSNGFTFHNFVSIIDEEFIPILNWENTEYGWFDFNEFPKDLHFGLELLIKNSNLKELTNNFSGGGELKNTTSMEYVISDIWSNFGIKF